MASVRKHLGALLVTSALLTVTPAGAQDKIDNNNTIESRAAAGEISALVELGDRYRTGDGVAVDLEKALDWYGKAASRDDVNANYYIGIVLLSRGNQNDHRRARQTLKRAVELCGNETNRATCNSLYILRELSVAEKELALYRDALATAQQALAIAENPATPDDVAAALLHEDIGIIFDTLRMGADALESYGKAQAIYARLNTAAPMTIANLKLNIGNAYEHIGRYEDSLEANREALDLVMAASGANSLLAGYIHNNVGWSLMGLKRFDEAYAEYELALPIIRDGLGPNGDKLAYVLNNMGIIREKQGRHEEAIRLNMRSLVMYSRLEDITLAPKRWALQSLSKSYAALGQQDNAILFAKMAVNTQQQIRAQNVGLDERQATALTEEWRGIYQELADLLIGEGRIAEAQYVLDLLKQQELIEFVRRDAETARDSASAALTMREEEKTSSLDQAMQRPLAIAAELEILLAKQKSGKLDAGEDQRIIALNDQLDASYESFVASVDDLLKSSATEEHGTQNEIQALNLEYAADRQDMLRSFTRPTVLLQAASLSDTLNLFLTTKDISIHRQVRIHRADLSKKVFEALTAIEARDPHADALMAELYDLLVKPVEQDLKDSGAEIIMLNLAGFLRYLPFAALRSGQGYLIEDYALAIDTPAAQTRFETVDRKGADAAGFGVTQAHQGFSPLPGVATELEAIFEGSDAKGELAGFPKLDGAFTATSLKDALKLRPKLLHVASHFKFVPGNETNSFLLLGDGEPLSLAQIRKGRGYRFGGVDLLTLSACETAKGSGAEGDEVESFGAIAQMNGASAVMATLWPIADQASGKLMADFYAGLVEDGLDKADALRRAQIAMLRNIPAADVKLTTRGASEAEPAIDPQATAVTSRHPYYWSPYILMGNWL